MLRAYFSLVILFRNLHSSKILNSRKIKVFKLWLKGNGSFVLKPIKKFEIHVTIEYWKFVQKAFVQNSFDNHELEKLKN